MDLVWLEGRATVIRGYEAMSLPGLLQTRAYAEATIQAARPADQSDVETSLDFRLRRQSLFDSESPPRYQVILDESALRRPFGGSDVMKAQLRHLLEMNERDNVELR